MNPISTGFPSIDNYIARFREQSRTVLLIERGTTWLCEDYRSMFLKVIDCNNNSRILSVPKGIIRKLRIELPVENNCHLVAFKNGHGKFITYSQTGITVDASSGIYDVKKWELSIKPNWKKVGF